LVEKWISRAHGKAAMAAELALICAPNTLLEARLSLTWKLKKPREVAKSVATPVLAVILTLLA